MLEPSRPSLGHQKHLMGDLRSYHTLWRSLSAQRWLICRLQGDREKASNPAAPECSVSGCGCGPALMVANGLADIGLGSDHVSGIRVRSSLPACITPTK
jgi:hypothetical protein